MAHDVDTERAAEPWPALPLESWKDTYATVHMLTQIVGKVRLARAPIMNQWWQVPLYVTARGLTTSPIPDGARTFELAFDFVDHEIVVQTSGGERRAIALVPRPVAEVYRDLFAVLGSLDIDVTIRGVPVEVPNVVPFAEDREHASYDPECAARFFDVLRRLDVVFKEFRAGFRGKASPVQFFWGSFDFAVTRFSGRRAPPRPGADLITRVAYDEECSSLGFWPGGMGVDEPALYSYAAPEPAGYSESRVAPAGAYYHPDLHEFILPYEAVRTSPDPRGAILQFAESTYDAAARLGKWPMESLAFHPEELLRKAA